MPEDIIMLRTMQALIQPKLVHRDLPLFAALLSDLFPGLEAPGPPADALRQAVEAELRSSNLQVRCSRGNPHPHCQQNDQRLSFTSQISPCLKFATS